MLRALLIDDCIKAKINEQVSWANRRENWYRALVDNDPPGDNPAYVMFIDNGFRVVYSMTIMPNGDTFRHLSVSIDNGKCPHPTAVFTIATMFGFSGGKQLVDATIEPGPWSIQADDNQHCVIVAQKV